MNRPKSISVVLFFLFLNLATGQPKTNLEIIYELVGENINQLLMKLPHEVGPFYFEFSAPNEYRSLENRYLHNLSSKGLVQNDSLNETSLKYSLDEIKIIYSDPFRDGLLGDYKLERKLSLKSTFIFSHNVDVKRSEMLESIYSDTLYYSDIGGVENQSLSITHGTKPSEPLFESLLEPVIAVGAVIVTIILLFTVRSK